MRSTVPQSRRRRAHPCRSGGRQPRPEDHRIRCGLVLIKSLLVAGVVALPLPALALGVRGLRRRRGLSADDRASFVMLVVLRMLVLLLVLALSGIILLSAVGAMVRDLELPSLV